MYRWLLLIGLLVAIAAGLIFGILNPDTVPVHLLFVQLSVPLGALVLSALVAGTLLGLVLGLIVFYLPGRLRRRRRDRSNGLPAERDA